MRGWPSNAHGGVGYLSEYVHCHRSNANGPRLVEQSVEFALSCMVPASSVSMYTSLVRHLILLVILKIVIVLGYLFENAIKSPKQASTLHDCANWCDRVFLRHCFAVQIMTRHRQAYSQISGVAVVGIWSIYLTLAICLLVRSKSFFILLLCFDKGVFEGVGVCTLRLATIAKESNREKHTLAIRKPNGQRRGLRLALRHIRRSVPHPGSITAHIRAELHVWHNVMICANFQCLIPPHHQACLVVFLVLQQPHVASSPFFPFLRIAIKTEELGAHLKCLLLLLLICGSDDFLC